MMADSLAAGGMALHFTIHDPEADVVRLLTRVRDNIRDLGEVQVLDMNFKSHFDGDDYVAELTVYYVPTAQ